MSKTNDPFKTLKKLGNQSYYSLPALEEQGVGKISRLPVSIRIMLESLLRNCDGKRVHEEDVRRLARWDAKKSVGGDVPFVVSRVILQDFTGVPLVVDLAAMRDAVVQLGFKPDKIEPQVPVDLVVDHSVQVDRAGTQDAFMFNLTLEFERNIERYEFLKWGQEAFKTFTLVPPGIGIVHQVNLEHIATVVASKDNVLFFDTLVGTDSHTTMINGLGVVGWGVGGIEAEAAMLGQPVFIQVPEVVGFLLSGKLQEGVTATDLTLRITEILRKEKVVDKFVEFFGEGAASLTVADRATIGNMAPEYGATIGFFPADEKSLEYMKMTARAEKDIEQVRAYLQAQKMFGIPRKGEVDYTKVVELDLSSVRPCVAGPKRPQDRIDVRDLKQKFLELIQAPIQSGGYGKSAEDAKERVAIDSEGAFSLRTAHETGGTSNIDSLKPTWSEDEMVSNKPITQAVVDPGYTAGKKIHMQLAHGSVVIAAITSCTNTSNPSVMLAAGLLAKKAVEKGLKVNPMVKTSLAPGSRVVTDYLERADLQKYLNQLGFDLVAYGCTTCIGNSGPLDEKIEGAIKKFDIVTASVLSGNRNFEARIHGSVKANFLMSPPLVVAYALAGRVDIDLDKEMIGTGSDGKPVYLRDIWPSQEEVMETIRKAVQPEMFKTRYAHILEDNPLWKEVVAKKGGQCSWNPSSTYIQKPPYFEGFTLKSLQTVNLSNMRCLAILGDSVTTDHISPAGGFRADTPAGKYLLTQGVQEADFNSYGSRRGNHLVMMRGAFANVRIRNKMAEGKEGGFTKLLPEGKVLSIFEASQVYTERKTPLIIFAGKDYGMGSSRDWAAKGSFLLGIRAVVASSFERIHRSNLVGMGVLPLEFQNNETHESLGITGEEIFNISGLEQGVQPNQEVTLDIGGKKRAKLKVRINSLIEVEYYKQGGIMPYVLKQLLA